MTSTLELDPEPRSVRDARAWVVRQLTTLGRDDLVDAARLGVSELVTNAILHAHPPILLRLGGTPVHPRVEVHDGSVEPPAQRDMTDDDRLLATIGRGLSIVAMYSRTWGAELLPAGKVVWFEPASEDDLSAALAPVTGEIVDLAGQVAFEDASAGRAEPEDRVEICLLDMPVRVFAHYRLWYDELRRELRLLALSHGTEYPVAEELSALTATVEAERRRARGTERLDAAIVRGQDRADLVYDAPATAPATMARLREVLLDADEFCREHQLLTAAPTPQLLELREWYLGEFERQGRGEPPRPWPGGFTVEPPAR
jgi:anti-sigma regulatory factor (Ser/Thr protein kinase)